MSGTNTSKGSRPKRLICTLRVIPSRLKAVLHGMGPSPTTPPMSTPLAISRAVKKLYFDYRGKVKSVRSPNEVFEEQLQALNAPYEKEKSELMRELSAKTSESARNAVAERLAQMSADWGARSNTLRTEYKATVEGDSLAYDKTLCQHNEELFHGVLRVFGRPLVEEYYRKYLLQQRGDVRDNAIVSEAAQTAGQQTAIAQQASKEAVVENRGAPEVAPAQLTNKKATQTQTAAHPSRARVDPKITPPTITAEATVAQASGPQQPLVGNPASSTAREPPKDQQQNKPTGPDVARMTASNEVSEVPSDAIPSQPSRGKRKKAPDPGQGRPPKRPRLDKPQASTSTQRQEEWRPQAEIPFKDVYQDGNASQKYIIGRYFGVWCIFRCGKCNLFFEDNPEQAAFQHLAGPAHKMTATLKMVIRELGVSVRGCNQNRRVMNNDVASAYFAKAANGSHTHQTPPAVQPTTAPSKRSNGADSDEFDPGEDHKTEISSSKRSRRDASAPGKNRTRRTAPEPRMRRRSPGAIIDPVPGQVYQAEWRNTKKWYAVLVLRTGSFDGLGIEGTIRDRHLEGDIPPYYKYDPEMREFDGWEDGYEDGDPFVNNRWFPVMFFDGTPFPDGANPSWVAAKGLQLFDRNDSSIEFRDTVLEFLDERGLGQVGVAPTSKSAHKHRKTDPRAALNGTPRRSIPQQKVSPIKKTTSSGPASQDPPPGPSIPSPAVRAKAGISEKPKRSNTQPIVPPATQPPSSPLTSVPRDAHQAPAVSAPAVEAVDAQKKKPNLGEEPKRSTTRTNLPAARQTSSASTGARQDTQRTQSVSAPAAEATEAQTKPSLSEEPNGSNVQRRISRVDQTGSSSTASASQQAQTESAPVDNTSADQQLQQQQVIETKHHLQDQATNGSQQLSSQRQFPWPVQSIQQDPPAPKRDGEGLSLPPETMKSEQRGDRARSKLPQILLDLQQLNDSKGTRPA